MGQNSNSILLNQIADSQVINNISSINFLINLIISLVLSILIGFIYTKYGKNISNRKEFAGNFSLLTMTTMFIITIVKSSLALSLGLVGALSIVRFRSAIKDPEELTYLFLCIAIGLGMGANQIATTTIATLLISVFIIFRNRIERNDDEQYMNLLISYTNKSSKDFGSIIEVVSNYSKSVNLRRYTEDNNSCESCLNINIKSFDDLKRLREKLYSDFPGISMDFVDNKGID